MGSVFRPMISGPGRREQDLRNMLTKHIASFQRVADSASRFGGQFDDLITQLIDQAKNTPMGPDILKLATGEGSALSRAIVGGNLRAFRGATSAAIDRAESAGRGLGAFGNIRGSFTGAPVRAALGDVAAAEGNLISRSPTGLDVGLALSGERRAKALTNSNILGAYSAIRQNAITQQLQGLSAAENARATGEAQDANLRMAAAGPSPFDAILQTGLTAAAIPAGGWKAIGGALGALGGLFGGGRVSPGTDPGLAPGYGGYNPGDAGYRPSYQSPPAPLRY